MREIVFRGKRMDNWEWVQGCFCPKNSKGDIPCIIVYNEGMAGYWFEVDSETVGQFTGLTDKNGKRIFEGDIVRIEYEEIDCFGSLSARRTDQGTISYDSLGALGVIIEYYNGTPVWTDFFSVLALTDRIQNWSFEIIGNIHDNPELLKGE